MLLTPDALSEMAVGSHVWVVRENLGKFAVYKVFKMSNIHYRRVYQGGCWDR